jgi:hypothetical protein
MAIGGERIQPQSQTKFFFPRMICAMDEPSLRSVIDARYNGQSYQCF